MTPLLLSVDASGVHFHTGTLNKADIQKVRKTVRQRTLILFKHCCIGALKAKHFRLQILMVIYTVIQQLRVFNLFMLPYLRATQYSGDQIGLALCGDLEGAIEAFGKIMVGKDIGGRVRLKGLLQQADQVHGSVFAWLAKLLSEHPHLADRYLNLIAFSRYRYPQEFTRYVAKFNNTTIAEIEALLPRHYPITKPIPEPGAALEGSSLRVFETGVNRDIKHLPLLAGLDGVVSDKRYAIDRPAFYIGANGSNDLVLDGDEFVSGEHAFVRSSDGQLLLFDADSTNGTWLNGQKVTKSGIPISAGDRIQIGGCIFEVEGESAA